FFQFAVPEDYELFKSRAPKEANYAHIALKVDGETFESVRRRLAAAQVPHRITDHGYCRSLYVATPDALKLELTLDPGNAADIQARRRADGHAELARWLAGDHRPNNTDHTSVFE
ncbi:MAG TPA: VOC family protein, partial [Gammaproteobacteria bacterium]|nr:VOC family protein [Gammaproteobacteria bacterium]